MRKITIDRLELRRLRTERNLPHRAFTDGISKRTYNNIEKYGVGTEPRLRAIARMMALPNGLTDFLPVQIIGAQVRERRLGLSLKRKEVAARCRSLDQAQDGDGIFLEMITAEMIGRIEDGNPQPPDGSHDLCRRLAAVLGCSFKDLLERTLSPKEVIADLLGELAERWADRALQAQDKKTGGITNLLDGGLTQPWTTAQVLVGTLPIPAAQVRCRDEIAHALAYLGQRRLPLGRAATELPSELEQGWPLYESEDTPVTEITCWVIVAYAHALSAGTIWQPDMRALIATSLAAEIPPLLYRQCRTMAVSGHLTGGFCPTVAVCDRNQRTYSTAMAVWALLELLGTIGEELPQELICDAFDSVVRGAGWLLETWNPDYGWVPKPLYGNMARHPGLSAQVLFVLTKLQQSPMKVKLPLGYVPALNDFLAEAARFFPQWEFWDYNGNRGINLGDVVLDGTSYRLESSEFFWAPWSLALLSMLTRPGSRVGRQRQDQLLELRHRVVTVMHNVLTKPNGGFGTCQIGEILYGISWLRELEPVSKGSTIYDTVSRSPRGSAPNVIRSGANRGDLCDTPIAGRHDLITPKSARRRT
jgi:transcriptional regulator with XRE-family HTH domain